MIKQIKSIDEVMSFCQSFVGDNIFSDPTLENEEQFKCNLVRSIEDTEKHHTIGVYQNNRLIGLFAFLTLKDENYLEMLVGLSKDKNAYIEMMEYLKENYVGCQIDFVYNPRNTIIADVLRNYGAIFDPEQIKYKLVKEKVQRTNLNIVPYSDEYKEGYKKIHSTTCYWTAKKVIEAIDRFNIFLALDENQKVVGYIDVTHCFEENEPYDLFVCEEYRCQGYGRALLGKAIENNGKKKMMLLVYFDNTPARHLYESMGFVIDEFGGSTTANLKL